MTKMLDEKRPIIALDFPGRVEAVEFLQQFPGEQLFVKVGMELYYQTGADFIRELKEAGYSVFLDLKLHDIPNTVYRAMKVLAGLKVDMVNVHAAGGFNMMEAAVQGLNEGSGTGQTRPVIIAVTQLTSTSEEQMKNEQLIDRSLHESVLHYALLSKKAGLDGVVCSAHEAGMIANEAGAQFLRVTPGIRPVENAADDQSRVVAPKEAKKMGSSLIVVGRPITRSKQPQLAYRKILREWEMG